MFVVDDEIEIDRPIADVYAYLLEPANYARWISDLKEIRTSSPLTPGQSFHEVSYFQGQRKTCEGLVVEAVKNARIVLKVQRIISGPRLLPTRVITLQKSGEATKVHWHAEIKAEGFMKLLEPLYPRDAFADAAHEYLFALKYILEKDQ